jgi:hypothetical protein
VIFALKMSATQDKVLKIPKMFAKRVSLPSTKCPVCNIPASQTEINKHLDEGCPPLSSTETPPDVEVESANELDLDQKADRNDPLKTPPRNTEDYFEDSDTDYEKVQLIEDAPVFRASQSLSNTPKRFGGLDKISSLGKVELR